MSYRNRHHWRDIDFRPSPQPGWRVIYVTNGFPYYHAKPLAGWLIQERGCLDRDGEVSADDIEAGDRDRRVVAAVHDTDGQSVCEADLTGWAGEVWYVAAPGQEDPTDKEAKHELDHRKPRGLS